MASNLLQLPAELLAMITAYIVRPSDLKSLCLTSHLLSSIATKQLYHTIELHATELSLPDGKGFLLPSNRGHKHVRCLSLSPESVLGYGDLSSRIRDVFRAALRLIPRDHLTTLM